MDRRPTDPIALALAAAIAEITARRAAEATERRRRIVVVTANQQIRGCRVTMPLPERRIRLVG
jgi:hypothetical protein